VTQLMQNYSYLRPSAVSESATGRGLTLNVDVNAAATSTARVETA